MTINGVASRVRLELSALPLTDLPTAAADLLALAVCQRQVLVAHRVRASAAAIPSNARHASQPAVGFTSGMAVNWSYCRYHSGDVALPTVECAAAGRPFWRPDGAVPSFSVTACRHHAAKTTGALA